MTIKYNLLNLPSEMQYYFGHTTSYLYDANGVKRKVKYTVTDESIIVPIGTTVEIPKSHIVSQTSTDYCGNNRELWRANDKKTLQRMQYYPSGLPWEECENAEAQPYKYNGKEFIEMHGYDTYDYGARGLYAALMKFTTVDPHCEKYYWISPYAYCLNNPIRLIDLDGRDGVSVVDKEKREITISQIFYYNKNNDNFSKLAITQDRTITGGALDGTTLLQRQRLHQKMVLVHKHGILKIKMEMN